MPFACSREGYMSEAKPHLMILIARLLYVHSVQNSLRECQPIRRGKGGSQADQHALFPGSFVICSDRGNRPLPRSQITSDKHC